MKNNIIFSVIAFIGIISSISLIVKASEDIVFQGKMEIIDENTGILETKDPMPKEEEPILESSEVDGGWWIRGRAGAQGEKLISKYKHYTKQSHASVLNGIGDYDSGGWQGPDDWSEAEVKWTLKGTNRAYYNYR